MVDSKMGDTILDAICERLRQKTYIKGSRILCDGGLIDKMVFIVRGKMSSKGVAAPLGEGDVCGEELLAWCIENSSVNKGNLIQLTSKHKMDLNLHNTICNLYIGQSRTRRGAFEYGIQ